MTIRQTLIDTLVTEYPEACRLLLDLVQAIDLEKRQAPDCDPEVQETFCLSDLNALASATIANLSMNDATPVESDHAFLVMSTLFADLERAGLSFLSVDSEQEIGTVGTSPAPVNFNLCGKHRGTVSSDSLVKDSDSVATLGFCDGRWRVVVLRGPGNQRWFPYAQRDFLAMGDADAWVRMINEGVDEAILESFLARNPPSNSPA